MFTTPRLLLRSPDASDLSDFLRFHNDIALASNLILDAVKPQSRVEAKAFLDTLMGKRNLPCFVVCERPVDEEAWMKSNYDGDGGRDAFVVREGAKERPRYPMIGAVNFQAERMTVTNRSTRFGVFLDEEHQNRGLGTELLDWVCRYVFANVGLHRLELTVAAANIGARRCYAKVGFVEEGIARKAFFRNGRWEDVVSMAMLEEEWWEREREREREKVKGGE